MKKLNINIKELIKGIAIVFLFLSNILAIPFLSLIEKNIISRGTALILLYVIYIVLLVIYYRKDLKNELIDFKKNHKAYLKKGFNYWLRGLFIMLVSSFIIGMIGIKSNANQDANVNLLKSMPIIEAVSAIILAPIIEELVFRKGFKKALNNKHLFAIATGLLFALVHVTTSIETISDLVMLIYLIPFGAVGIAFGYLYYETDNIYSTIFFHSLHNAINILELILIMAVGGILWVKRKKILDQKDTKLKIHQ